MRANAALALAFGLLLAVGCGGPQAAGAYTIVQEGEGHFRPEEVGATLVLRPDQTFEATKGEDVLFKGSWKTSGNELVMESNRSGLPTTYAIEADGLYPVNNGMKIPGWKFAKAPAKN